MPLHEQQDADQRDRTDGKNGEPPAKPVSVPGTAMEEKTMSSTEGGLVEVPKPEAKSTETIPPVPPTVQEVAGRDESPAESAGTVKTDAETRVSQIDEQITAAAEAPNMVKAEVTTAKETEPTSPNTRGRRKL